MPKDTVVMAFSLSPEASAYVRGAGRGRRSAMVNRCILYYKDNRVEELIDEIEFMRANIEALQNRLLAHGELASKALNEAPTPPCRNQNFFKSGPEGVKKAVFRPGVRIARHFIRQYLVPFLLSVGILIVLV